MSMFNDVYNPLPDAVKDPERVREFFHKNKLAPYAGSSAASGHALLKVLYLLSELSHSKEAAINFILRYGFDGDMSIVPRGVSGIKIDGDDEPVDEKVIRSVSKKLSDAGFEFDQVIKLAQRHISDDRICGNMYLQYEEITVGSTKRVVFDYIHPKQFFYRLQENDTDPQRAIVYRYGYSARDEAEEKFEEVGVYPFFTETKTGRKTIMHLANLKGNNTHYGRPRDQTSMLPMYVEFAQNDLAVKVSGKEIVTKYILAVHRDSLGGDEEDSKKRADALRMITTRQQDVYQDSDGNIIAGDDESNTIVVFEYEGEKAPVPVRLDIARDSKWFETQEASTSNKIFVLNGIPKDLAGFERSKGSLNSHSGEFILQQFNITDISLIRPIQRMYAKFWNISFDLMADFLGAPELKDLSIQFPTKISQMIEETLLIDDQISKRTATSALEGKLEGNSKVANDD